MAERSIPACFRWARLFASGADDVRGAVRKPRVQVDLAVLDDVRMSFRSVRYECCRVVSSPRRTSIILRFTFAKVRNVQKGVKIKRREGRRGKEGRQDERVSKGGGISIQITRRETQSGAASRLLQAGWHGNKAGSGGSSRCVVMASATPAPVAVSFFSRRQTPHPAPLSFSCFVPARTATRHGVIQT